MTKLSPLEKEVVRRLSTVLEQEYPEAEDVIVFGSRARGTSGEGSDLDVAVILNVDRIVKENWDRIWQIKWAVLERINAEEFPLSLILLPKKEYDSRASGVELAIKREGIPVWHRKTMQMPRF